MTQLTKAHSELFRRTPDETYGSLAELQQHCIQQREVSLDAWQLPRSLSPHVESGEVTLALDTTAHCPLNDWSFTQLCRMSGISKDTINRLTPETASLALQETLPRVERPVQILSGDQNVRSLHGVSYTRLWNAELLDVVGEFASDFQPPQPAVTGGTGLYCGEQDMFAFLIDPTGWAEIDGEAFAPGFFVWNSEVGRRSLGIQTFWFQSVCQNHIVWDATEVTEFTRKHTANVRDGLSEIRRLIERLVARRNERRDSFASVIRKAMHEQLGTDADTAAKELTRRGIPRGLAAKALELARQRGALTIFAVVDALTKLTQTIRFAGDRVDADAKAAALLEMAV